MDTLRLQIAATGDRLKLWLNAEWLGMELWQFVLAFAFITGSLFARRVADFLLNRTLVQRLEARGGRYVPALLTALIPPLTSFLGLIGFYLASQALTLPTEPFDLVAFVRQTFHVAVAAPVIWALMRLVDVLAMFMRDRAEHDDLPVEDEVIPLLRTSLKIFVGVLGALVIVQNLGYSIASLLGGLGIGGLAIALAAQDTLANVFGSIVVFTDRPFKVATG